jgi:dipeptidyl aminopeptidase/acylaminoacyl peptidase
MIKNKRILITFLCALLTINSCMTKPKHPELIDADLPKLIPLRDFIINRDFNYNYKLSPDGTKIAWLGSHKGMTIFYKEIGTDDVKIIDTHSKRNIYGIAWAQDSRRILYLQDQEGNENHHIYLVDTENPKKEPVDLTPFEDTLALIHQIIKSDPENILIIHNHRDKKFFDLYSVNLLTQEQSLVAENPGDVYEWITDKSGDLRGRLLLRDNGENTLEIVNNQGNWETILKGSFEDEFYFMGFTPDDKGMWLISNINRERISFISLDLETGEEKLIYEDPNVDLDYVAISNKTGQPLVAFSCPDYPALYFFDDRLKKDMEKFLTGEPAGFYNLSFNDNENLMTFTFYTDKAMDHYLLNRETGEEEIINRHPTYIYEEILATVEPISFESRDGLTIHGYLTLPKGTGGRCIPMVLFVHGGPWWRDYWGYNDQVQFLANRGYAVLQINYRGSTGYGRSFMEAAVGEFAGKMHDDLIDGVEWAIEKGIADPEKIAIYGGSYGGYATLVGLTFTPDVFACGVDVVGMSNLVTLLESTPEYWEVWMPLWYKYVGDPNDPEDRKEMEEKSPLFKIDNIIRPLLIAQGGNDPRVKQRESDQMVEAMIEAGKEVEYILFPDEGHGFTFWKNRLVFYRRMEDFLAEHLGGRSR